MRKHFLILMLMALLPLVGWADNFNKATVQVGEFTYGDVSAPTIKVYDLVGETNVLLNEGTDYNVDTTNGYEDAACTQAIAWNQMQAKTTYYIKITGVLGSVYNGASTYGTLVPAKKALTISWAGGALNKKYGENNPSVEFSETNFSISGYVTPDDINVFDKSGFTYTISTEEAGSADVTFSGVSAANYSFELPTATMTIGQLDLSAIAQITAEQGDVTYTGKDITGKYTIVIPAGKIPAITPNQVTLTAGADYAVTTVKDCAATVYKPTIKFTNANYSGSITPTVGFMVNKAPMSVVVKSKSAEYKGIAYEASDFTFEFAYYGFVGDDIGSAVPTGASTPTVSVADGAKDYGTYSLTIDNAGTSDNYNITAINSGSQAGKLNITKAPITIKAENKNKVAGTANPSLSFTITGIKNSEGYTKVLSTFPNLACSADKASPVGEYPITFSSSAVAGNNYEIIAHVSGTLTITQAAIVITVMNKEKVYGGEDPDWDNPEDDTDYVVAGLKEGDNLNNVKLLCANEGQAGNYSITATYDEPSGDYASVTVVPGVYMIHKAPLTVTIPDQSVAVDGVFNDIEGDAITVTGEKGTDVVADLYTCAFKDGIATNTDITYTDGIEVTITSSNYYVENETNDENVVKAYGFLIVGEGSTEAEVYLDDTQINNYDKITDANGKKITDLTVKLTRNQNLGGEARTWDAEEWNTIVLPFAVTPKQVSEAFGYAIVNVINAEKSKGNRIVFELNMNETIPANTPFAVKNYMNVAAGTEVVFHDVMVKAPKNDNPYVDAGEGKRFYGTYTQKTLDKENSDCYFLINDGWAFIKSNSDATWDVVPFNAYIQAAPVAAARGIQVTFEELDGTTTAINSIDAENAISSNDGRSVEGTYNLNGVKIDAPTQKGVYIHNGKKVVIK